MKPGVYVKNENMPVSKILFAAISAAGLSLAANLALGRAGATGIAWLGPVLEESLKTGGALFFNASVPGTHVLFGFLEAAGDLAWGGRRRIPAALFGILAHTIFGLITYLFMGAGYPVYTALLASIAVHVAWNTAVLKIANRP